MFWACFWALNRDTIAIHYTTYAYLHTLVTMYISNSIRLRDYIQNPESNIKQKRRLKDSSVNIEDGCERAASGYFQERAPIRKYEKVSETRGMKRQSKIAETKTLLFSKLFQRSAHSHITKL